MIWYEQFRDKKFFAAFLRILEYSHKSADLLITNKICKESFITRKGFADISDINFEETTPAQLTFLLSLQYTIGLIEVKDIFRHYKNYFDSVIKNAAENDLKKFRGKYFIAALGSYGAGEMSFASDIDLVFVSSEKMDNQKQQKIFEELLKKLKELCGPFDIDCRLKPEGEKSPLVWSLENYRKYLEKRAKVWEFQSLCKVRYLAGDNELFDTYKLIISSNLRRFEKGTVVKEIIDMRKMLYPRSITSTDVFNIKKSKGGIADIDFTAQYFLLNNPPLYMKFAGTGFETISGNALHEFMEENDINILKKNFDFLKNLEISLQNIYNTSQLSIIKEKSAYKKLAEFLNLESELSMFAKIEEIRKENHLIFNKYMGQA